MGRGLAKLRKGAFGDDEQDMHAGVGVKALVQASEVPRRAFLMSLHPRV